MYFLRVWLVAGQKKRGLELGIESTSESEALDDVTCLITPNSHPPKLAFLSN